MGHRSVILAVLAGASGAEAFTGALLLGGRAHNGARTVSCLRGSSVVMQTAREDRVPELSRRSALLGAAGLVIGAAIPQQASAAGSTATFSINTAEGVKGDVVVELFADQAPKTVEAFTKYAKEGLYDGTAFHRVNKFVSKAVLVGGDPFTKEEKFCQPPIKGGKETCSDGDGYGPDGFFSSSKKSSNDDSKTTRGLWDKGGPGGWRFDGLSEVKLDPEFNQPIERGTIVMRRFDNPRSAGSQFIICLSDMEKEMGGQYAAFGKVTSGLELLDEITKRAEVFKSPTALSFPRDDKKLPNVWSAWDLPVTRQGVDRVTIN
jgi:peptidyl-prolyl cis-trans isomerase B (cyclophilin B)